MKKKERVVKSRGAEDADRRGEREGRRVLFHCNEVTLALALALTLTWTLTWTLT